MLFDVFCIMPLFFHFFFEIAAAYGVYILKPIPTEGLTLADAGRLMEQTFEAMSEIFELTTAVSKEDLWMDVRESRKILEQEDVNPEKGEKGGERR